MIEKTKEKRKKEHKNDGKQFKASHVHTFTFLRQYNGT